VAAQNSLLTLAGQQAMGCPCDSLAMLSSVNPFALADGCRWPGIALLQAVVIDGFNPKSRFRHNDQFWPL
jgi:hypothetical protein